jgi:hypothetical protein
MLRACLLCTSLALVPACTPDEEPTSDTERSHQPSRDPAHPGDEDGSSQDASAEGEEDAADASAQGHDASSGDASSGGEDAGDDASAPGDAGGPAGGEDASAPGDAGDDASTPGGDASTPGDDASTPGDAGDDASEPGDATLPHGNLCTSCGDCDEWPPVSPIEARHLDGDLVYPDPPPASGDHNPCWTRYGVHETPVPDERWVHNLEHGAVVFLYNCPDGCASEVARLRNLVESCGILAVLTPYDLLPKRFAVVSWGHRLVSDCLDVDVFRRFYDLNVAHGPEAETDNPPDYCPP